eukprot:4205117-Pleurochrysis_carterae.AAC.2
MPESHRRAKAIESSRPPPLRASTPVLQAPPAACLAHLLAVCRRSSPIICRPRAPQLPEFARSN